MTSMRFDSPGAMLSAFPLGTEVTVHPASGHINDSTFTGEKVTTGTVKTETIKNGQSSFSAPVLSFGQLAPDTPYVAHALVGDEVRAVRFRTER